MTQQNCGSSVYAKAVRVAVLEADGVPLPGPANLYVTDALVKLTATPAFYQPPVVEVPNAGGDLCVSLNTRKRLKWYDLDLELCNLDPELDFMLVGGEKFTQGGFVVGGSVPEVNVVTAPYGVSLELWTVHVVNSDIDPVWPYVHWVLPRSYWSPDAVTWDISHMPRMYKGFTSQNPSWFNGPLNDWNFSSDRSIAWAFTKTLPGVQCGAVALNAS